MATRQSSAVIERVWSRLPEGARAVLESELSPTDLQSLLLSLARTRARRIGPAEALRRWKSDRFVRPATIDPGRLSDVENRLWRRLRNTPFVGLALSPVTVLGTCTSVGAVDQNRIVSIVRSGEVVSDPTNVVGTRGGTPPPVECRSGASGQLSTGATGTAVHRTRRLGAFRALRVGVECPRLGLGSDGGRVVDHASGLLAAGAGRSAWSVLGAFRLHHDRP
jgi:hypothetical protein